MIWINLLYVIIFLLFALLVFLSFFIYNLLNQIDQLEKIIKESPDLEENVENFYKKMLTVFVRAKSDMDRVDKRGSYSSDDEVGFGFKVLHQSICDVLDELEKMNMTDEKNKKA
jgi:molecular chaperone GrpE (heat shock protein)